MNEKKGGRYPDLPYLKRVASIIAIDQTTQSSIFLMNYGCIGVGAPIGAMGCKGATGEPSLTESVPGT